jgi:RimJ/RimL family protein N-acetyltransferase
VISSPHGFIRATEEDDSPFFFQLYDAAAPRFALLDQRREPLLPTMLEIRETLGSKEAGRSQSFTMEHPNGDVAGFMVLRGLNQESGYCELTPLLLNDADHDAPLTAWALGFILDRAFNIMRLRKLSAHTLCREAALRAFLDRHAFACDGVQREMVFSQGQWFDVISHSRTPTPETNTVSVETCPCP